MESLAEEEFLIFRGLLRASLDPRKQVAASLSFAARIRETIRTLQGGLLWSHQMWLLMVACGMGCTGPLIVDDSKDQRESVKVCAAIHWPVGGSEFSIPYEIALMYGGTTSGSQFY